MHTMTGIKALVINESTVTHTHLPVEQHYTEKFVFW